MNVQFKWQHTLPTKKPSGRIINGRAVCLILDADTHEPISIAESKCHENDIYSKRLARKASFAKAVSKENFASRAIRTELWNKFKAEHPNCFR